ncbi:MAG TPA: alkaline phosphatase family protein [Candidatus Dormibacteraeota bacterium]|jgi:hypothetical protein|nr:alkaline phosphatase family protein [Candidatus Dormibacteraeota bacterium]
MGVKRVVVLIQENKTPDFYFPTLRLWGADIEDRGNLATSAPNHDQPHDRNAWVHYKMGDWPAEQVQIDNDTVLPYYSWLAKTFTFCDHHFGVGTNSTAGHMMLVGGQTPTLRNYFGSPHSWNLPTIFGHAQAHGVEWAAFPDQSKYPISCYSNLAGDSHVHTPDDFLSMAAQGSLPPLCYVWSPSGFDEHPPLVSNPGYVTAGENLTWQRIDAAIKGRLWQETAFILTWDDWGGYADHVSTPDSETIPDALDPSGFQVIGGSRIPLLMFGGQVEQGVESEWHGHASVIKTVIDLLGLPAMGIARVDTAPSLAGRIDSKLTRPVPPPLGSTIAQPTPPSGARPTPPGPWKGPLGLPMPDLIAADGGTIPAPSDGLVKKTPPSTRGLDVPVYFGVSAKRAHTEAKQLAPKFSYQGGPLITQPEVYLSFWGTSWADPAQAQARANLVEFVRDLLASDYMNILSQYGVGQGAGQCGRVVVDFNHIPVARDLTQAGIATEIQSLIDQRMLPEPGSPSNLAVMLFLDSSLAVNDPGAGIVMCEPQGDTAFGFHYHFTTDAGNQAYYSVIPALDDACLKESCQQDSGCSLHLSETQEQRRTQVASHEFSEMVTDPELTGWLDPSSGQENGDLCNGQVGTIVVGGRTWTVQLMYSHADDLKGQRPCTAGPAQPIPSLLHGKVPSAVERTG